MTQHSGVVRPQKVERPLILSLKSLIKPYFFVTKPATVSLLVLTGLVGFVTASEGTFTFTTFLILFLALTLGCAGANTLTNYIDRDIDAVMVRTKNRPLPSLQLAPERALIFGIVLAILALGFSFYLNLLTFVLIFAGVMNNVVMYSLWSKRKTPLNIFIGSFAGGLPALAGYAAYADAIDVRSLLLGGIVMFWIPVHVWSIALKHREDYQKARVPMLPAVVKKERAAQFIALMSCLLVAVSLVPAVLGLFGAIYLYSAIILGLVLLFLSLRLLFLPGETRAWAVFKLSSFHLGFLFLAVLLDTVLTV